MKEKTMTNKYLYMLIIDIRAGEITYFFLRYFSILSKFSAMNIYHICNPSFLKIAFEVLNSYSHVGHVPFQPYITIRKAYSQIEI